MKLDKKGMCYTIDIGNIIFSHQFFHASKKETAQDAQYILNSICLLGSTFNWY